jgi:hypothetical protein
LAFQCPPQDKDGFRLGQSGTLNHRIFCSYPNFPGENPNDFFCTYNATSGLLVQDLDSGLCPANAVAVP